MFPSMIDCGPPVCYYINGIEDRHMLIMKVIKSSHICGKAPKSVEKYDCKITGGGWRLDWWGLYILQEYRKWKVSRIWNDWGEISLWNLEGGIRSEVIFKFSPQACAVSYAPPHCLNLCSNSIQLSFCFGIRIILEVLISDSLPPRY